MDNPELQSHLAALEAELEEGDITQKGYQKRRTLLLAQYGVLDPAEAATSATPGTPYDQRQSLRPTAASSDRPDSPTVTGLGPQSAAPPPLIQEWGVTDGGARAGSMTSADRRASYVQPPAPQHRPPPQPPFINTSAGGTGRLPLQVRNASVDLEVPEQPGHSRSFSGASYGYGDIAEHSYIFGQDPGAPQIQHSPPQIEYENFDEMQAQGGRSSTPPPESRASTQYDHQNFFLDFTAQAYDPGREPLQLQRPDSNYSQQHVMMQNRYSGVESAGFSPTVAMAPPMLDVSDLPPPAATDTLLPLEPREVTFAITDPHNDKQHMSEYPSIAAILRDRAKHIPKHQAYCILDTKGKELATCSWEKLASRAEKVAQVIREKSNLYRGDRVALVYREVELIDFAVALLGCFIAGVVAVPINNPEDYQKLNHILTNTQAHLALTTDSNLKAFQRNLANHKQPWPRGVEWWKTNEFGSYHVKKKGEDLPAISLPDIAYIEFSRAPTGDLRGVVLSHETIMHQMATLSAIIRKTPERDTMPPDLLGRSGKPLNSRPATEILATYLDPRQGIGLIMGVLLGVYGGQTTVWFSQATATIPGLYANIVTRFKASLCLADYPGLKAVAYNYQTDPHTTRNFSKKYPVNLSSVRLMMIDTLTVDPEFHEILADRWLKPLGNPRAREVVAPMLCLPEHGGMVIAMRDWLGGEERMGCPLNLRKKGNVSLEQPEEPEKPSSSLINGFSSLLSGPMSLSQPEKEEEPEIFEAAVDRTALKTNDINVLAVGDELSKKVAEHDSNALRVGAFGYPIPDAMLAVVDPETSLLCGANVVGEIWVDSPSLSGGFWLMPKQTDSIFHARPYRFEEGDPNPVAIEPEFLRTGLLGYVLEGKVFILGLYEDRLRQRVEWVDAEEEVNGREEYRYFFVQHLVVTIMRNMSKVFDCSAFDVFVNDEHLPIILLESHAASTAPTNPGGTAKQLDIPLLDSLSERVMEVLLNEHQLRVYCVMITAPNTLPRIFRNGRKEIGNMLCRKEFDAGTLPCVHVEFGVERAVRNLPIGIDPVNGVWSPLASQHRQELLGLQEKQYSGVDHREVIKDDRTHAAMNSFQTIVDIWQFRTERKEFLEIPAYCTIDGRGKEGKAISFKKLDQKICAVALQLKNKYKLQKGQHAILIYTHSEDFLYALHACLLLGIIAIPLAPLDSNRPDEDIVGLLHMIQDFGVDVILVNNEVDHLLKSKPLSILMKQAAHRLGIKLPPTHNTVKAPKQTKTTREMGLYIKKEWLGPDHVALVWAYWTPDQRRVSVALGHDTILGICKVIKETCQMSSTGALVGCVRSTNGIGFVMSWLLGIYLGASTYLVSPIDFANNPMSLFLALSRLGVKDTYATPQMMDHAIATMPAKGFTLGTLHNLMISCEGRPRPDIYQKVRLHFAVAGLSYTSINTIYSHVLNPMITTRSYMSIEPIELWLDPKALRQGLVYPVDPETCPGALLVQDSGMVPVSTQIAIVNPETNLLCHTGEFGEIWVESEACVKAFYGSKDPQFDAERFMGRLLDSGEPSARYVRTGDLGFLHTVSRPIGHKGALVEMQLLFVLGGIGETFEVNGMSHFPVDIEYSIERCHRNIVPGGSAVFQAGGLVVVVVEVRIKSYLASMVPVIVNAILDAHQLVVDIVAFVANGDFPRSRLSEKQRARILGSWVKRKLRTIAQFGIRNRDDRTAMQSDPAALGSASSSRRASTMTLPTQGRAYSGYYKSAEPTILETASGRLEVREFQDDGRTATMGAMSVGARSLRSIGAGGAPPLEPPPRSERRRSTYTVGSEGGGAYSYPVEGVRALGLHDPDAAGEGRGGYAL